MAQIKIAEYTFDNSVGDVMPTLTPNTITMTTEDSVSGTTTRRIVYIDNATMPTCITLNAGGLAYNNALLTVDFINIDTNITSCSQMFYRCKTLQRVNTSNWNTSNVTSFYRFCDECSSLVEIDVSHFNVSKANGSFYKMFNGVKAEVLDVSKWNVNTTDGLLSDMFNSCSNVKKLDLSNWKVKIVHTTGTDTAISRMFGGCSSLEYLDLSGFDFSEMNASMEKMFYGCSSLREIKGIETWDVSKVTSFVHMFRDCSSLKELDLRNWVTSGATHSIEGMFYGCENLEVLRVDNFDTSKLTHSTSMGSIFYNCKKLKTLNLNSFTNPGTLGNINNMFSGCSNLEHISMPNFVWGNCISMSGIFKNCTSLKMLDLTTLDSSTFSNKTYGIGGIMDWITCPVYYNSNICSSTDFTDIPNRTNLIDVQGRLMAVYDFNNNETGTDVYPVLTGSTVTKTIDTQGSESNITHRVIGVDVMPTAISFNSIRGLLNVDYLAVTNSCTSLVSLFENCFRMTYVDTFGWDTSNVTRFGYCFRTCSSLTEIRNIQDLKVTSKVTEAYDFFNGCSKLTSLDLTHWDVSGIKNGSVMFKDCSGLTSLNISNWDVSSMQFGNSMFQGCTSLSELDLTSFKTTAMESDNYNMFSGWTSDQIVYIHDTNWTIDTSSYNATFVRRLSTLLAKYTFDNSVGDCLPTITGITTSDYKVSDIVNGTVTTRLITSENALPTRYLFKGIKSLTKLEFLEMSEVTNMQDMLSACSNLEYLDVSQWNTSKVTNMYYGFIGCAKLTEIIGIEDLDVSNCTSLSCLFESCSGLTSLDLSKWNVTKCTLLNQMFYRCTSLVSVNLSGWNTTRNTRLDNLFSNCTNLTEIIGLETWDTSNVTNMSNIFNSCRNITSIEMVRNWNTGKVTEMAASFGNMTSLTSLEPILNWDTSKVTSMANIFSWLKVESFSFANWDTSKVRSMYYMLAGLPLDGWDLTNLNTSSVTNMENMFESCTCAKALDLSHFITDNVTSMRYMFTKANLTELIGTEKWSTDKVTNMLGMFDQTKTITEINLSSFNTSLVAGCTSLVTNSSIRTVYYDSALWTLDKFNSPTVTWIVTPIKNNGYWLDMTGITQPVTITMTNPNNLTPSEIVIDWGDGTRNSELTHTYSTAGQYVIATNLYHDPTVMKPYLTKAHFNYSSGTINGLLFQCPNVKEFTITDNFINEINNSKTFYNMDRAFNGCYALEYLPSNFTQIDIANITGISSTFSYSGFKELDFTGWTNHKISNWSGAFYTCQDLEKVNFGTLDMTPTTNMATMFAYCSKLKEINVGTNWNTSNVTNMGDMFVCCKALTSLDVSNWNFEKCIAINQFIRETNLVDFNMSGVTFGATGVNFQNFAYQSGVQNINMSNITTAGKVSFESSFYGCGKLKTIDFNNSHFKPSNMQNMFRGCSSLQTLDLSMFNTSECTSLNDTFNGCKSLTNLDLSNFNTSNITVFGGMCSGSGLIHANFSSFTAESCTGCANMFYQCTNLQTVDLSSFKPLPLKVVNAEGMFASCVSLINVDISNFDTNGMSKFLNFMAWGSPNTSLGLLYASADTINDIVSTWDTRNGGVVYYYDADASQLTPVEGVTFKKYSPPTTIQLPPHIQLHSLPDGTRDEVDIRTGILTHNTGECTWNDSTVGWGASIGEGSTTFYHLGDWGVPNYGTIQQDMNLPLEVNGNNTIVISPNVIGVEVWGNAEVRRMNIHVPMKFNNENEAKQWLKENQVTFIYRKETPTTEQLILNYNNSCDYGCILPTGMCDKYDVVNSMYTQTMTSILLDGENTWDAMEEMTNVIKFTATGTTVGVEELNMLGAGGLYCDNDLFPNINDDSDVPHCRVDEAGNKFYIYVDKEMLMSPDLIGWQIWLQSNPFNLIYELAEHSIYVQPYEELDPTQARWEGMDCMRDGAIKYHANNSDNITIYPTLEYVAPSINNFEVTMLEPNTDYTIYAEGINTNDTINLGGTDINFNNGTVYTSGDNQWLRIDNNDSFYNMVITKGDTTGEVVPYFEGMTSVENPKVQCGESTVSYTDLKLRSLPNGVKDTINVVTGEYVQRVGEVVLDGSDNEEWVQSDLIQENTIPFGCALSDIKYRGMSINNKFITTYAETIDNDDNGDYEHSYSSFWKTKNVIWFFINKTRILSQEIQSLKLWLSKNPITVQYELAEPITTKLDSQTLLAYADGTINLSSDTGLLPTMNYSVPSTNTFHLPSMKTGTRYTLKYPSASGSITIGDINYSISSDSMLFTTPLKINGDTSAIIFSDANPENVVLLEGAYNKREVPFFTGVKSVKNPNITIIDQLSTESTTYNCETEIELRGLPNGVADKLDIIKGKLTTNVGIRAYQDGDENLPNIWTDGYETVYALSSPVVTNVTIDRPTVTTNSLIDLTSDYLIPQLNYRAPSSNNFPLDLLQPNTTYTLYADTLTSGSYILGGTRTGVYSQPHTIILGDMTDNLLTFNGDLGLSNVMLVKGNSLKTTLPPYFLGIRSVTDGHLLVEGMAGEINELTFNEGIVLRDCNGVKDFIDLITCTLTKRTGEITLIGAEGWYRADNESTTDYNVFKLTLGGLKEALVMCDTLQSVFDTKMMDCIHAHTNELCIVIANATIGGNTVNALKSWLNQHPTTVVYQLRTPIEVQLENTWTTTPPTSYDNQTEISSTVSSTSLKPMISVTVATTTLEEIVTSLEAQNAQLEEENVATMLALTSVYETMVAPSVATASVEPEPQATTYSMRRSVRSAEPIGMSVSPMGMVYARLVSKGFKSVDEVPYNLQAEVMYALRGME